MNRPARRALLGIDTGGTFTDAVILDESTDEVLAKAKTPTTPEDLTGCVGDALRLVLEKTRIGPDDIGLVSLSTTLATNALVEGRGRPAALVVIGFEPDVLQRGGLGVALGDDPVLMIAGGHSSQGEPLADLDLDTLAAHVDGLAATVDAVAVVGQFSVRNAAHELAACEFIRERTGLPVTASHELSARINGPKRALTALLNARLVALIDELLAATEALLEQSRVSAPLMVVRGDGSLVSADFVRRRPIETILSGPAASMVGAGHLTDTDLALVADIGGTTTDIAVLADGIPEFGADGATVGGHATMVPAVRMDVWGLGGDSEIRPSTERHGPRLLVGPRRAIPLSMLVETFPDIVLPMLERQLASPVADPLDGMVLVPSIGSATLARLDAGERDLANRIGAEPIPADRIITRQVHHRILSRLVSKGFVRPSSFTPTDASLLLRRHVDTSAVGARAALAGATLLARQRDRVGEVIAADAQAVAVMVTERLVRRSAEAMLAAALDRDGVACTADSTLAQAALDRAGSLSRVDVGLSVPIVALGASAGTYYPSVGKMLGCRVHVPAHADVANAIGAVVGRVRLEREVTISAPRRGSYRVHIGAEIETFFDLGTARDRARAVLVDELAAAMRAAGAPVHQTDEHWSEKRVEIGGGELFIEGTLRLVASGRPIS